MTSAERERETGAGWRLELTKLAASATPCAHVIVKALDWTAEGGPRTRRRLARNLYVKAYMTTRSEASIGSSVLLWFLPARKDEHSADK